MAGVPNLALTWGVREPMQFHEYRTLRNQFLAVDWKKYPNLKVTRREAKSISSADLRRSFIGHLEIPGSLRNELDFDTGLVALAEDIWVDDNRPFYNVWPIAAELAKSVNLDLPFSAVAIPFSTMLLRFAKGHEPHNVPVAMLYWPSEGSIVHLCCYVGGEWDRITLKYMFDPDQHVQDWLAATLAEGQKDFAAYGREAAELLIRLCVFIGLLGSDRDIVTPIVLAKDRAKYDSTDENAVKTWLEDRAVRRAGRGFDVGRGLQLEKERSPHWRNPHLCLFWTGPGRTKPMIQMRSGAVVQKVSMAEVPTGYLGPETDAEDILAPEQTPREAVSKSRRFEILKRDGYRCQLCGRSQRDGVTLHVDHRVPLAKGGANEDENLWTLCEDCNLGKSDRDLG